MRRSVLFVLDVSLSLDNGGMGVLYNHLMEIMDSLDVYDDLTGDMLLMGTGVNGDECEWLSGSMVPLVELRDMMNGMDRAMGLTPVLNALEHLAGRVATMDPSVKPAIIFLTDGQTGYVTAEEVGYAVSGCLRDCPRLVLLTGYNHDEDVMDVLASSPEHVTNDPYAMTDAIRGLLGGFP